MDKEDRCNYRRTVKEEKMINDWAEGQGKGRDKINEWCRDVKNDKGLTL